MELKMKLAERPWSLMLAEGGRHLIIFMVFPISLFLSVLRNNFKGVSLLSH